MAKYPSPCIDVCKYKNAGHCIGCGMTPEQKKDYKRLEKKKHQAAFLITLMDQQERIGRYRHWHAAYQKACRKKGLAWPPKS